MNLNLSLCPSYIYIFIFFQPPYVDFTCKFVCVYASVWSIVYYRYMHNDTLFRYLGSVFLLVFFKILFCMHSLIFTHYFMLFKPFSAFIISLVTFFFHFRCHLSSFAYMRKWFYAKVIVFFFTSLSFLRVCIYMCYSFGSKGTSESTLFQFGTMISSFIAFVIVYYDFHNEK